MSEQTVNVHVDLRGRSTLVGYLHARYSRGREGATFEYESNWLKNGDRFALEPNLSLGPAPYHTGVGRALFGSIGDSAPDRWGRNLISRAERRRAESENRSPRTLREIDYLLAVSDETRSGALRFRVTDEGPFLAARGTEAVPPLVFLPKLLAVTAKIEDDEDTDADLRLLLAPGSSLGGARPKSSVRDKNGRLLIAKFPSAKDEYDLVRWEGVALGLAAAAGVVVPEWRIEDVADRRVLLLSRFDRRGTERVPFLTAMSLLGAADNETHSYPEIADALRQHGAAVTIDLSQLWRRMVFNILVSNTDDHLRNHGVLFQDQGGWRLSPAYDLNPVPLDIKPRVLTTAITRSYDTSASLDLALEVAGDFGLELSDAKGIAAEVGRETARWREKAASLGLDKRAVDRMASAFEHADATAVARLHK